MRGIREITILACKWNSLSNQKGIYSPLSSSKKSYLLTFGLIPSLLWKTGPSWDKPPPHLYFVIYSDYFCSIFTLPLVVEPRSASSLLVSGECDPPPSKALLSRLNPSSESSWPCPGWSDFQTQIHCPIGCLPSLRPSYSCIASPMYSYFGLWG